jgi:hypothetical protein
LPRAIGRAGIAIILGDLADQDLIPDKCVGMLRNCFRLKLHLVLEPLASSL